MRLEENDEYRAYVAVVQRLHDEGLPIKEAKMMGMPSLQVDGKGIGGFFKDRIVVKLDGERLERALAIDGADNFDPIGGRPMRQWVTVPISARDRWFELLAEAARNPAK
jgi:hypothetical protein